MSLASAFGLGQPEFTNHIVKAAERSKLSDGPSLRERALWKLHDVAAAAGGAVLDRLVNLGRLAGGGRMAVNQHAVIEYIPEPAGSSSAAYDLEIVEEDAV